MPIYLHQIMLLYFNSLSWSILVGRDWSVRLFYPSYYLKRLASGSTGSIPELFRYDWIGGVSQSLV